MKIIDILVDIANGKPVPLYIKCCDDIWYYEEDFGQYKNKRFQELIKFLHGDYKDCFTGFTYPGLFNIEVTVLNEEDVNENNIR